VGRPRLLRAHPDCYCNCSDSSTASCISGHCIQSCIVLHLLTVRSTHRLLKAAGRRRSFVAQHQVLKFSQTCALDASVCRQAALHLAPAHGLCPRQGRPWSDTAVGRTPRLENRCASHCGIRCSWSMASVREKASHSSAFCIQRRRHSSSVGHALKCTKNHKTDSLPPPRPSGARRSKVRRTEVVVHSRRDQHSDPDAKQNKLLDTLDALGAPRMYMYMHMDIHICTHVCICIYIYVHTCVPSSTPKHCICLRPGNILALSKTAQDELRVEFYRRGQCGV